MAESKKDLDMAAHLKTQIEQSEKELHRWHKRGEKISKTYRDERDDNDKGVARKLNLFWSNTETLRPAIYSKTPVPICERRFLDKDTTGRVASTILERTLRYEVQMSGFDRAIRRALKDKQIPGRGQVWIRYNPLLGEPISPEQTADNDLTDGKPPEEPREEREDALTREVLRESLAVDYVHWQDYGTLPALARTEEEVEGKYRRLYMSRSDLIETFGKEIGRKIELDHAPKDKTSTGASNPVSGHEGMQATIYEIWWKPTRQVYFIAKSYDEICKQADDPLKLEGFFPCPEPLNATMTNDTTIPVPDYAESQDQYYQIDDLTKRIDILTSACKVVGVYDASAQSLKRVFEEAQEPNLIPVDSWAMFAEKGGLKGAIDWVPIETVANTLKILIDVRSQIMEDLDRTTGIPDIMRGTSDARETMGGQRLKSNNAATRLQEQQDEMGRFCRDVLCIMGEIISEHYSDDTLIQVSGALYDEGLDPPSLAPQIANSAPLPPQIGHNGGPPLPAPNTQAIPPQSPPVPNQAAGVPNVPSSQIPQETPEQKEQRKLVMIQQAIQLLRNDKLRGFRIDIETDSTIQGDAQAEKEARIEFVEGVTKFMETAGTVVMSMPESAPLMAKMLQFAVRGFRVGRDLESAIEDFCDKAELDAKEKASQPPQPNPEQIKAQSEMAKAQAEIQRQVIENQGEKENAQIDLQAKQLDFEMKKMELRMKEIELEGKKYEAAKPGPNGEPGIPIKHDTSHLEKIAEAAKIFDLASRRNAAPKRIVRGPDGKASHVITDFQEN